VHHRKYVFWEGGVCVKLNPQVIDPLLVEKILQLLLICGKDVQPYL
jgi:hypothetical protein